MIFVFSFCQSVWLPAASTLRGRTAADEVLMTDYLLADSCGGKSMQLFQTNKFDVHMSTYGTSGSIHRWEESDDSTAAHRALEIKPPRVRWLGTGAGITDEQSINHNMFSSLCKSTRMSSWTWELRFSPRLEDLSPEEIVFLLCSRLCCWPLTPNS